MSRVSGRKIAATSDRVYIVRFICSLASARICSWIIIARSRSRSSSSTIRVASSAISRRCSRSSAPNSTVSSVTSREAMSRCSDRYRRIVATCRRGPASLDQLHPLATGTRSSIPSTWSSRFATAS